MKEDEKQQRRDKWRKLVEEYLQSSMTQKSFCEQLGLSLPQFVYYRGQFKMREKVPPSNASFEPVKIPTREKVAVTAEVKLSLPNGFQCVFPVNTDAIQIKRLVEALLSC
jgi:hypothetical protein